MDQAVGKTPIHLWIVGGLATVWNAFGCFDYFMTRTRGAAHIKSMMPDVDGAAYMAYIDSFPIWASAGWAIGVWFGLAGCVLLLLRRGLAVPTLFLSMLGAVVGLGYQIAKPPSGVAGMGDGANVFVPIAIMAVTVGLFIYARAMRIRGVLR